MPTLHPPFAHPGSPARVTPPASGEMTSEAPMPHIDQFLDELPSIDDFLLAPETFAVAAPTHAEPVSQELPADAEGWAAADWQSYDWSGLASLGAPEPEAVEAHAAWSHGWPRPRAVKRGTGGARLKSAPRKHFRGG